MGSGGLKDQRGVFEKLNQSGKFAMGVEMFLKMVSIVFPVIEVDSLRLEPHPPPSPR